MSPGLSNVQLFARLFSCLRFLALYQNRLHYGPLLCCSLPSFLYLPLPCSHGKGTSPQLVTFDEGRSRPRVLDENQRVYSRIHFGSVVEDYEGKLDTTSGRSQAT